MIIRLYKEDKTTEDVRDVLTLESMGAERFHLILVGGEVLSYEWDKVRIIHIRQETS